MSLQVKNNDIPALLSNRERLIQYCATLANLEPSTNPLVMKTRLELIYSLTAQIRFLEALKPTSSQIAHQHNNQYPAQR